MIPREALAISPTRVSNFLQFHAVFARNCPNNRMAPLTLALVPRLENPVLATVSGLQIQNNGFKGPLALDELFMSSKLCINYPCCQWLPTLMMQKLSSSDNGGPQRA